MGTDSAPALTAAEPGLSSGWRRCHYFQSDPQVVGAFSLTFSSFIYSRNGAVGLAKAFLVQAVRGHVTRVGTPGPWRQAASASAFCGHLASNIFVTPDSLTGSWIRSYVALCVWSLCLWRI